MLKKKLSRPGHVGFLGETYVVQASQFSQAVFWGGNLGELLSVGEAELFLGCLIASNVRGICTDFRSTQLLHFSPLGFLSCTVLIVPAPVLFY